MELLYSREQGSGMYVWDVYGADEKEFQRAAKANDHSQTEGHHIKVEQHLIFITVHTSDGHKENRYILVHIVSEKESP